MVGLGVLTIISNVIVAYKIITNVIVTGKFISNVIVIGKIIFNMVVRFKFQRGALFPHYRGIKK